jgi:hypothetical protein
MLFKLSFKIENCHYKFMRITHLLSKVNCQIIDFRAQQFDTSDHLLITVSLKGDKKKSDKLVQMLNNTIDVMDTNFIEFRKEELLI